MSAKREVLLLVAAISALLFALFAATNADSDAKNKLKVKVFYEALCPDSMHFVRNQLYYAMVDNGWLPYTDLQFVPYGKVTAWTDPSTNITTLYCQHGTTECELNALHACLVENNSVQQQLEMINCLLNGYSTSVDKCSTTLNIDVTAALRCKATRSTADILRKYGEQTDAIDISFVPSIELDGVFNRIQQRSILYNFDTVYCRQYKAKYNVTLAKC